MNEDLSRLMDDDLPQTEVDRVLTQCRRGEVLATWACYHVIGDSLRGSRAVSPTLGGRIARALADEPTVLAPQRSPRTPAMPWAFAAAATMAAVAVVGWTAYSVSTTPGTTMAKAREAATLTAAQVRPQGLPQDYLLVHQEYSPATALQGVQPYLRAVASPTQEPRR